MGGFFKNAGEFLANSGKSLADITLSTVGADNVIQDSDYKGYGSYDAREVGRIGGNITGAVAPIAGGIVAGPAGVAAVKGAQAIGGGLNPESEGMQQPVAPVQPYYNGMNAMPQQTYAQAYAYGGYVRKPIKGYANGDFVGPVSETFDTTSWTDEYRGQPLPQNYNGTNSPFGQGGNYGIIPQGNGLSIMPGQEVIDTTTTQVAKASGLNPYIAAGTLGLGAYQVWQGNKGLKALQKEAMPNYTANPALTGAYNRAQQAAQRGYTPEQESAFKSNLATTQNTAYKNAVSQSGGNLAQAINAGLQSQNINALNQFAASDAAKRQENIQYADSFAPRFQNIQDENTRNALNYRIMREQALGAAKAQGQSNLASGANATIAGISQLYKG